MHVFSYQLIPRHRRSRCLAATCLDRSAEHEYTLKLCCSVCDSLQEKSRIEESAMDERIGRSHALKPEARDRCEDGSRFYVHAAYM